MHYYKLAFTYITMFSISYRKRIIFMPEEQTNVESGLKSRIAKYLRWFLISVTMVAIIYTVIMATIKKFG